MFTRYHQPYGDRDNAQDPYPDNWIELNNIAGGYPKKKPCLVQEPEKTHGVFLSRGELYRGSYPLPNQIPQLVYDFGIQDIVSLVHTNAFEQTADNYPEVDFHEYPFYERSELTAERCRVIVDKIIDLKCEERTVLIHCNKGAVRTGMVVAMYRIMTGQKGNFSAAFESVLYGNINLSTLKEIMKY